MDESESFSDDQVREWREDVAAVRARLFVRKPKPRRGIPNTVPVEETKAGLRKQLDELLRDEFEDPYGLLARNRGRALERHKKKVRSRREKS